MPDRHPQDDLLIAAALAYYSSCFHDVDPETLFALAGILGRCPTGLRVAELEEMR